MENKQQLVDLINRRLMISVRAFAYTVDINYRTIYAILNGKRKPSKKTILKVCTFFGVNPKEYL